MSANKFHTNRTKRRRGMHRWCRLTIALLLIALAAPAAATHETDHRYDVKGQVLGADKRPLDGVPVTILKDGEVIGSERTDRDGAYSIRVHLHDSDIGATLTVRAGAHQRDIRMQAKAGDQSTARVHQVDFVGGQARDVGASAGGVPGWIYFIVVPLVLVAMLLLASVIRQGVRRLRRAHAPAHPAGKRKRKGKH